ncbi:MAG: L-rhamnose mutarotase [Microscillaceae bacterium]|nr:L-rhamnose mutarotase [Microscillaceae bacterium]
MEKLRRYCLALDLKDEPELIQEYKNYHEPGNVWPEIIQSIRNSGIEVMEIYLTANRLVMVIETNESFDFARKATMDAQNPKVQEWETLMGKFQQVLPWAMDGVKWVLMERVFVLNQDT